MKSYFIDTAATVTFFTVVAALSELLIAGMDPKQVLIARLIMIPVMMVTARPYGLWRDWFFSKTRPQRWITNVVCDIIASRFHHIPSACLCGDTCLSGRDRFRNRSGSECIYRVYDPAKPTIRHIS